MSTPTFRAIIEPFRIHSVEPLRMTTREQREAAVTEAGYKPVRGPREGRADRLAH